MGVTGEVGDGVTTIETLEFWKDSKIFRTFNWKFIDSLIRFLIGFLGYRNLLRDLDHCNLD